MKERKGVEALFSPDQRDGFLDRQAAVHDTADILGLQPSNTILFGGAAMALHGLDTHIDHDVLNGSFDMEAYITKAKLTGFPVSPLAVKTDGRNSRVQIDKIAGIPLAFTGLTGGGFNFIYGYDCYEAARVDSIIVRGLAALSVDALAAMKMAAGRPKDKAGLIQAHLIGRHEDNPLTHSNSWQSVIATAVEKVLQDCCSTDAGAMYEQYPEWLIMLSRGDFLHPAFEGKAFEQVVR